MCQHLDIKQQQKIFVVVIIILLSWCSEKSPDHRHTCSQSSRGDGSQSGRKGTRLGQGTGGAGGRGWGEPGGAWGVEEVSHRPRDRESVDTRGEVYQNRKAGQTEQEMRGLSSRWQMARDGAATSYLINKSLNLISRNQWVPRPLGPLLTHPPVGEGRRKSGRTSNTTQKHCGRSKSRYL